jgi:RNA polymerase sigma-70 factor, ECF subfamily
MVVVDTELKPLVREARAGQREAWNRLFHRYQLPLFAYVSELVRDEQAAWDVVQDTFVSACRHLGTLRDDTKFGSWLFGIAHQKCAQHWRGENRKPIFEAELPVDLPDSQSDPANLLIRREQEEAFLALLAQLPAPQRAVLLLHFIEEFSIADIAVITGVPPGTVKSRLHHAKLALRRQLENGS